MLLHWCQLPNILLLYHSGNLSKKIDITKSQANQFLLSIFPCITLCGGIPWYLNVLFSYYTASFSCLSAWFVKSFCLNYSMATIADLLHCSSSWNNYLSACCREDVPQSSRPGIVCQQMACTSDMQFKRNSRKCRQWWKRGCQQYNDPSGKLLREWFGISWLCIASYKCGVSVLYVLIP